MPTPTPNARSRAATGGSAANSARKSAETHDLLNYRLSERLAQEELATVYRATHLTLDRPVQVTPLQRTPNLPVFEVAPVSSLVGAATQSHSGQVGRQVFSAVSARDFSVVAMPST